MDKDSKEKPYTPGDGIRSLKSTNLFRRVNFELYAKPNATIMALGLIAITSCATYLAYMRTKFETIAYYAFLKEDENPLQKGKKLI